MVVIVSKQAYLICEAINYIVINEVEDSHDDWNIAPSKKKKVSSTVARQREYIKKHKPYHIIIDFNPVNGGTSGSHNSGLGNNGHENVRITVHGLDDTVALYAEIVEQIREQMPDVLYVDKLVERYLVGKDKK
jgi:hypothetical protein